MLENKIKISIPKNMVIDKENSTSEDIVFKPKAESDAINFKELYALMASGKEAVYYINHNGDILRSKNELFIKDPLPNHAFTRKQLNKVIALNMLMTVVKFVNDGWSFTRFIETTDSTYTACTIKVSSDGDDDLEIVHVDDVYNYHPIIILKNKHAAQKVIDILGEKTVALALKSYW